MSAYWGLEVIAGSLIAEANAPGVAFGKPLEVAYFLGESRGGEDHQSGGQGVKGSGVADAHVSVAAKALKRTDYIKRTATIGLVN